MKGSRPPGPPKEEGALLRCCARLAAVPCPSLCALLALSVCALACAVATLVGAHRSLQLLDLDDRFASVLLWTLVLALGTLLMGGAFLLVSTLSSNYRRRERAGSNCCLRAANACVVALLLLLQCAWLLVALGQASALLLLKHIHIVQQHGGCVRMANYGFPVNDVTGVRICADGLDEFYAKLQKKELFLCFAIAFLAATCVLPSLSFFLICTTANLVRLARGGDNVPSARGGQEGREPRGGSLNRKPRNSTADSLLIEAAPLE